MAGWSAVAFTITPILGGFFNAMQTRNEVKGWYKTLKRPSWTPPDAAFGPVWTALYAGMGYASYLVWRDAGGFQSEEARLPLVLYGSQLLLNFAWTPIFFGRHNLSLAFYEIVVLYGAAAATGLSFFKVNRIAGYLFVPYMAWLSIATGLAYRIYMDNPAISTPEEKKQ